MYLFGRYIFRAIHKFGNSSTVLLYLLKNINYNPKKYTFNENNFIIFFKIMEHSFFLPFIGCISAIDSQNVIDVPKKKAQIGHWTGFLSARPCDCWKFVCFMHSSVFANFNIFSKMHTQNRICAWGRFCLFVCSNTIRFCLALFRLM